MSLATKDVDFQPIVWKFESVVGFPRKKLENQLNPMQSSTVHPEVINHLEQQQQGTVKQPGDLPRPRIRLQQISLQFVSINHQLTRVQNICLFFFFFLWTFSTEIPSNCFSDCFKAGLMFTYDCWNWFACVLWWKTPLWRSVYRRYDQHLIYEIW